MSEKSPTLVLRNHNIHNCSDMAKVAIKSENITSFGGIFHVMGLSCKSPWIGANQLPKDFGYPEHEERDILYTSYLRSEALHLRVQ